MSTPNKICNDGASKSNDDVCEMNNMVQNNMSITTNNNTTDVNICANCGKEGSDVNNTCNKCKMVKYCNAACKKKHRHKHKKDCEEHQRLAAERAAKLHDEALFRQPPLEHEDCPICFLRMPSYPKGIVYKSCCGKMICSGCIYAVKLTGGGDELCPFCRAPTPSNEEAMKREKKLIETGDSTAIEIVGGYYACGVHGYPQNHAKALELFYRAAELGNAKAYFAIGCTYDSSRGVEVDKKKAKQYYELAAMKGNVKARYNLGCIEKRAGNMDRARKHWMIASGGGSNNAVKGIKGMYLKAQATKEDYTKALQAYQEYLNEVKSAQRDEAAVVDKYKYY